MPRRTIVCPDCGETAPSGRLSCPACGAMLAAVAGGVARPAVSVGAGAGGGVPGDGPSAIAPARIETRALWEASPDDAPAQAQPPDSGPAVPLAPSSVRQTPVGEPDSIGTAATSATSAVDGGYLPPGTLVSPATPPGPAPSVAAPSAVRAAVSAPDATEHQPTEAPLTWEPARLDQALGYAAAAGSGLIAFGMLMPWSDAVIGARGVSGLFDTWGLAGPAHILVLLWALAVLAVSIVPNRIPVGIRSGLAGLMLGVFSVGLVWPYLIGPLGAGIGVMVVTVGALVLTGTGVVSAWRDRHAARNQSV